MVAIQLIEFYSLQTGTSLDQLFWVNEVNRTKDQWKYLQGQGSKKDVFQGRKEGFGGRKEILQGKWACAKAIMEAKHLKLVLNESEGRIAQEKARAINARVNAQIEAARAIEEAKMIIKDMRYSTIEEIAQLRSKLYVAKERICFCNTRLAKKD